MKRAKLKTQGGKAVNSDAVWSWARAENLEDQRDLVDLVLAHNGGQIVGARVRLGDGTWTSHLEFVAFEDVSKRCVDQDMPGWGVPFVRDGVGNFFLLDRRTAPGGVWFFDHDSASTSLVSPSIVEFLASLDITEVPDSAFKLLKAGRVLEDVMKTFAVDSALLSAAVEAKRADAVRWLLEHGVTSKGCVRHGVASPEILRMLLEYGGDPNEASPQGMTPLMRAAEIGQAESVEILLSRGANWNSRDAHGKSALDLACKVGLFRKKEHDDVVRLLESAATQMP